MVKVARHASSHVGLDLTHCERYADALVEVGRQCNRFATDVVIVPDDDALRERTPTGDGAWPLFFPDDSSYAIQEAEDETPRSAEAWKKILRLHARSRDLDGVLRALQAMNRQSAFIEGDDTQQAIHHRQLAAQVLEEDLEKGYILFEGDAISDEYALLMMDVGELDM